MPSQSEAERLTRLEVRMDRYEEDQKEIQGDLKALLSLANQGQGALWLLLKVGSAIAAICAAAKFAFDLFKSISGH